MKILHQNRKEHKDIKLSFFSYSTLVGFCFLLCAFCSSSCKKFIEIPPPTTLLVTQSVFSNNATATSAQTNIYTLMWGASYGSSFFSQDFGLYSDELQNYSTSSSLLPLYQNNLLPTTGNSWGNIYAIIYDANAVINGLQTISGCSPAVKKQLTGEAYFVRAFYYFYLTNIYGDVPLALTTDYTVNNTISRSPRVQVLQQVITDLQTSQGLLNSNYVDATDTVTTTERVRPTKAAASALLARAYLYLGDYAKDASQYANAEAAATAVINNRAYILSPLSGAGSVFLKNSSEAIWQLQTPSGQSYDTWDGYYFVLTGAPSTGTSQSATISTQLQNAFESGDQRFTNWVGSYTTTTTPKVTYLFPYKYKNKTFLNQEYTMVLRLGEQYLIRAEAEAHEGKTSNAIADLNVIRTRAGLPAYAGATDQASLLAAILHERQVELFCEWGHRWFDLCRTGNAPLVMGSPGNVCHAKGGTWSSSNYQLLLPIPTTDLLKDANLTQNPGY